MRKAAVAGAFYPGDSLTLQSLVDMHLDNVTDLPKIEGQIMALIVPHAGLVYSGQIAAYAYKLLEGKEIDKVILCGPAHRYRLRGLSVYGEGVSWETPLGIVACDDSLCQQLTAFDDNIIQLAEAHAQEHCLEVQLPYLQTVLDPGFKIVPMVMGMPDAGTIGLLAEALQSLRPDGSTIMVASSDWQHYRPAGQGWKMDSIGLDCIKDMDPKRLQERLSSGEVEMCGGGAVVAIMKAAMEMGADRVKILRYGDSGDVSKDKESVVGYAAAVIYRAEDNQEGKEEEKKSGQKESTEASELPTKFQLSQVEKQQLLEIARRSIVSYLADGTVPEFEVGDNLQKYGAAFVTLTKDHRLRGCIGYTTAMGPLFKTVSECAIQAAVHDRRFRPVTADEMDEIKIEISVLTPMQKVDLPGEIEIGRDGLMIFLGANRGLLLPQVAVDYGWDRQTFMEETCRKANLPPDAYKNPEAVLYKFQAVIFSE